MNKWVHKNIDFDLSIITERYKVSEVFAKILINKGFKTLHEMDAYLNVGAPKLGDVSEMKGMSAACDFLKSRKGEYIRVVGDYDVDGVMSSYILVRGLRELGYKVDYRLPHRVHDGYGIRPYMVDEAKEAGADIILTCDNGISAIEAVNRARELQIPIIITDHHETPKEDGKDILPNADFIVDPKQSDCKYPYKDMCGAGIAYRMIQMLTAGDKAYNPLLVQLMIPASIATVCDVVPLTGENRIITRYGLSYINKVCQIMGLNKLIEKLEFKKDIGSFDYGFRIGPCINAAGRLESAEKSLKLMLTEDENEAEKLATYLKGLNDERKDITERGVALAESYIEEHNLKEKPIFLIYLGDLSESVVGIVAGRIREKYYKPVMVVVDAHSESSHKVKGSGRSIPAYHMQRALNEISELLLEYGGHALAAGFSFEKDRMEEVYTALLKNQNLTDEDLTEEIYFDAEVDLGDISINTVKELALMEPFGTDNPSAKLVKRHVLIKNIFLCGRTQNVGRIVLEDGGRKYYAVDFDVESGIKNRIMEKYDESVWNALTEGDFEGVYMDIMYAPDINDYNNSVQFKILDSR